MRSGMHATWRMPSCTVPRCTLARSPSSRSATIFSSPVANTSSGILRLVLKPVPGSVMRPLARASFISSSVPWRRLRRRQHDEAALGAGDVDRRVEHERQHLVEHAARAERAQAFEQRRELAQIVDRAGVRSIGVRGTVAGQEHHVGAAGAAELDAIAVRQLVLGDRLAVDVGAVARALVAQDPVAVLLDDLGVLARHVAADQTEIALRAAADAEQLLVDRDDALTEAVVYFQPGVWLRHMQEADSS